MSKIARFVIWICSKFTRSEIELIISSLSNILANRNPDIKPKDDFKEKHPNYRNFSVDPLPPLTEPPVQQPPKPTKNYKLLLAQYLSEKGKPLNHVKHRPNSPIVPDLTTCPICNAPHIYLYYNDGNKRSQLKCKVCNHLFQLNQRFRKNSKTKFFCPYCNHALFKWKERKDTTIYKCCNDNCPHRIKAINNLNPDELALLKKQSSQFKLCYQYRQYHFNPDELKHSSPDKPNVDISKIHNSTNILCLVLSFYVSFAMSARKTALILRSVFNVNISYQTVLNYAADAAFYCHSFNLKYKGDIDPIIAGDETYIKVQGKHHYVFFFISSKSLKITAYHVADNRGVLPAITSIQEAIRTAKPNQQITIITDGNPSYPAGIHFINANSTDCPDIQHRKVIGLQNLDEISKEFRAFKQLAERLNRTFKHHAKSSHGFNCYNGLVSLTTLVVTHYNFIRPHMSLGGKPPIQLPMLENIPTIQDKWAKILSLSV